MNTEKILKETKVIMIATLVVGLVLLVTGICFDLLDIHIIKNNRAIVGLSFIPLSVAFVYYLKLTRIKKSPQSMREILVHENDERLVALKNEADAKAFKITQGALFLAYFGYTLMVPEDIFESVGWWILLVLLFVSFISQGLIHARVTGKDKSEENEL
jgi:predicted membrane chloride channel (bestrophin family)